jgi:radical SAM superfamily enzyme with C-terminal helix-hairpin-helix motif
MLRRVAPVGTVLKRVKLEEQRGRWHFGRPLGSYPLLAGIASSRVDQNDVIDVVVTDHGSRSVTGIQSPVDINRCGMEELETLPGIGKARARRIMQSRPFFRFEELESVLDEPRLLDEFREIFLFQNP